MRFENREKSCVETNELSFIKETLSVLVWDVFLAANGYVTRRLRKRVDVSWQERRYFTVTL